MTTPANEEKIMEELEELAMTIEDGVLKGCKVYHEATRSFLRSALASYAMHLKGEMPKNEPWEDFWGARVKQVGEDDYQDKKECQEYWRTRQYVFDEVHAILDEKIRKLTEV